MVSTRRTRATAAEPTASPQAHEPPAPAPAVKRAGAKASQEQQQQPAESVQPAAPLAGNGVSQAAEVTQGKVVLVPSDDDEEHEQTDEPELVQEPLDAFAEQHALIAALRGLLPCISDPTAFLQANPQMSKAARGAAQALYDYGVRSILAGARPADKPQVVASLQGRAAGSGRAQGRVGSAKPMVPQLCVDKAFDAEQIWMQLELAGHAALSRTRKLLARAAPQQAQGVISLLHPQHEAALDAIIAGSSDDEEEESGSENEQSDGDDDSQEGDEDDLADGEADDQGEDDDQNLRPAKRRQGNATGQRRGAEEEEEEEGEGDKWRGGMERRHPVEDRFLALQQMEAFLQDGERQAARAMMEEDNEEDEDEEDEEGDDFNFGGGDEEGGEGDDDEEELKRALDRAAKRPGRDKTTAKAAGAMYSDFFGPEAPEPGQVAQHKGFLDSEEGEEEEQEGEHDGEGDEEGLGQEDGAGDLQPKRGGGSKQLVTMDGRPLSTHQKRLLRMQEQIRELEESAMGDKEWQLTGEVDARSRPLNSALEVDMDFDTTARPPPEPTEEAMADIEAMIKKRINDHRYDDVVRVAPPPVETKRREIDLQDSKADKGLAEQYEQDFTQAIAGVRGEEAQESKLHQEARMLYQALVAKLDALSHFHFAPKPVIEDLTVRSEVAAVAMEEAAPVTASAASMRLPGEVFKPQGKGQPKAEEELTQEERKRRRAKRKRAGKAEKQEKESTARARALAAGQQLPLPAAGLPIVGRKSAALAAPGGKKKNKAAAAAAAQGAGATQHARTHFGKSAAVFAQIQASEDLARAGGGKGGHRGGAKAGAEGKPLMAGASLKL